MQKEGYRLINQNIFVSNNRKKQLLEYRYPFIFCKNNTCLCFFSKENKFRDIPLKNLIFGRVKFMRNFYHNYKPLYIWIWMTDWKKTLPNKTFTEDHINSGSSSYYTDSSDNGKICIWRREELLKVLVHEIIHSFHIDKYDPSPVEAYVELRAVYFNIYLELMERNLPISLFNEYLEKEKKFGVKQCKRIRRYDKGNTNIRDYLDERNRLLNNKSKTDWENLLRDVKVNNSKKLSFTITEKLLDAVKKKK